MTVTDPAAPRTAPGRGPLDAPLPVDGAVPAGLDGALVRMGAHPAGVSGVRFCGGTARRLTLTARSGARPSWTGDTQDGAPGLPGAVFSVGPGGAPGLSGFPGEGSFAGACLTPPVRDPRGGWHTVAVRPGSGIAEHLVLGPDGSACDVRPFALPGAPLVRALGLTERFLVVFDLPVTHHRAAAMMGSAAPYRWRPGRTARIGLLNRNAWDPAGPQWFAVDPCFVPEVVNAYEDRGRVVVDAVRHDRAFEGPWREGARDTGPAGVHRWSLDPWSGTATGRRLAGGVSQACADPRHAGRRHHLVFCRSEDGRSINGLDLAAGTTQVRDFGPGVRAGRPVFVPRPGDLEGDGWIMVFTGDRARRRGELLVLDALNLAGAPQAVVHLPDAPPDTPHTAWLDA
ncbi:carotenoid 9,10-9',10' cleavage dioxygenase [Sphaerisporangium melleum]|uniref:Dioxygenase n=1 Tax=Sphaerisporangium melleum TaxID=321316 RepID=A0A917VRS9_9ACTN|nr:carotenoid oxygenase family protein [Sphaerisporangium melleum]GGL08068.1 carotenoid 9,10-9',10' cleavage dioxygenase [Sphaerisporangium melleum]GII74303.1 carotenoid 9,10-9',10' cleavage dioxygenase [Sphaerisporangium melleum]